MLSAQERLDDWSSFRDGLPNLDEETQIKEVVAYWARCPFSAWSLDPDQPEQWPTIWEILNDGDYCSNAIAVGMEATLRLSGWSPERLQLLMIRKLQDGEQFFIVLIDEVTVLNYSYGEATPIEQCSNDFEIRYRVGWSGRSYKRLM